MQRQTDCDVFCLAVLCCVLCGDRMVKGNRLCCVVLRCVMYVR